MIRRTSSPFAGAFLDTRHAQISPGGWVRFGNQVALYGDYALTERIPGSDDVVIQETRIDADPTRLYVVTQKARAFQRRHPSARVLLDKGRYLLVEFPAAQRPSAITQNSHYRVQPLSPAMTVFEEWPYRPLPAPAHSIADDVSETALQADIEALALFPTRNSTSVNYADAAAWAQERFRALNYSTRIQNVNVPGGTCINVLANFPRCGTQAGPLLLLVAHLDSINQAGSEFPAPGADDNASGVAAVLELARLIRGFPPGLVRFALFGGEEQGLYGSRQYVASLLPGEHPLIRAVVNFDMIGRQNSPTPSVLLEGSTLSQTVIDALQAAAGAGTILTVQTSLSPWGSDHVSFLNADCPPSSSLKAPTAPIRMTILPTTYPPH
jgi:hypothetical protein